MDLSTVTRADKHSVPPRSTEGLTRIPEALQLMLEPYRAMLPDPRLYGESENGVLLYFQEVAGPYAQLIDKGFPTGALHKTQLRPESIEYLTPHVGELLRFLVCLLRVVEIRAANSEQSPGASVCRRARSGFKLRRSHEISERSYPDALADAEIPLPP